jgi:membrane associated rhomboid family serine protease
MSLDDQQPRREPVFNIPRVVAAVCALLFLIQSLESFLSPETYGWILIHLAFVPGRLTFAFAPDLVSAAFNKIAGGDEVRAQIAAQFLGDGSPQWWTFLTYAFLHDGWAHVGLNCVWLVAFGGAVAKRMNTLRFLLLLAICAIAGAIVHYLTHITDLEPVVGASAAVSGAMGAAARFVFQSGASLGVRRRRPETSRDRDDELRQPALTLMQTLTSRRSLPFILLWFASNFVFGISGVMPGFGQGVTVAWEAHIGGFLAGLLLFGWFDPPPALIVEEED